jgi:hypothetical protein
MTQGTNGDPLVSQPQRQAPNNDEVTGKVKCDGIDGAPNRQEAEADGDTGAKDDWRKLFQNVPSAVKLEALKTHALDVRRNYVQSLGAEPAALSRNIGEEPLSSSYNLVYVLHSDDDVRWIARIPIQDKRRRR